MTEEHGWDPLIVEMALGLAAKESISEPASGSDRYRGKRFTTGYIADGIDPLDVGVLVKVSDHCAGWVESNASSSNIQSFQVRGASDGPQHAVEAVEATPITGPQRQALALFQRCRNRPGHDLDAGDTHLLDQRLTQHFVELAQQAILAREYRDLGSQGMEH